jgi:hypothetical protein
MSNTCGAMTPGGSPDAACGLAAALKQAAGQTVHEPV